MNILPRFFIIVFGGILNRIRGGLFIESIPIPKMVRILLISSLICWSVLHTELWIYLITIILMALCWTPGWGSYFDLGRNENGHEDDKESLDFIVGSENENWDYNKRWLRDFLGLSLRGLLITLPLGLSTGSILLLLSGSMMGIVYEISWRIPSNIKHLKTGPELGEFLFGVWLVAFVELFTIYGNHTISPLFGIFDFF